MVKFELSRADFLMTRPMLEPAGIVLESCNITGGIIDVDVLPSEPTLLVDLKPIKLVAMPAEL